MTVMIGLVLAAIAYIRAYQPDALPDLSTGQNRCGVLALNGTIPNVSSLLRTGCR